MKFRNKIYPAFLFPFSTKYICFWFQPSRSQILYVGINTLLMQIFYKYFIYSCHFFLFYFFFQYFDCILPGDFLIKCLESEQKLR